MAHSHPHDSAQINRNSLSYNLHQRQSYGRPTFRAHTDGLTDGADDPTLDFHLPSRQPLHGTSVAEWAGGKKRTTRIKGTSGCFGLVTQPPEDTEEVSWRDVHRNIKCMDQLYDATFYSWLKSEDNVHVTAMYLHRIANEYPLSRIVNALKWLISDWRLESISTLVRNVTMDWVDEVGDLRRAHLLRHLTSSWATQYTTTLITMVLSVPPYLSASSVQRERFLRAFTQEWDFSKLSEFFMCLQSPANIDYKVKCVMLQEAARREKETLVAKMNRKKRLAQDNNNSTTSTTITTSTTSSNNNNAATPTNTTTTTTANNNNSSNDNNNNNNNNNNNSTNSNSNNNHNHNNTSNSNSSNPTTSNTSVNTNNINKTEPAQNALASSPLPPSPSPSSSSSTRRHHRRTSSNDVNDIKRLRLSTPPELDEDPTPTPTPVTNTPTSSTRRSATPDHHHHHHHHLRCVTTTSTSTSTSTTNTNSNTTATTTSSSAALRASAPSSTSSHLHSAASTSASVSADLSHLHLAPSSTAPSPTVADAFACHHPCYPYNPTLQVHELHRRRSSSNASTCSTASTTATTTIQTDDSPQDDPDPSSLKKRSAMNTGQRAQLTED
ncbi:hypothetical protein J3Q64DRAFT_1827433 [Phycomyces blakesleeanus]|uniref:Uncharacterized protein n=1 Tax=Phycomyces blakesleeanus TaxID=4837 RepID=A0ABR3BC09_PHYBL